MPKMPRWWWIAPVLVLVAYVLLQTQSTSNELRYDELLTKVRADEVESVILDGELVRGELKQAEEGQRATTFTAARPDDPRLVPLLEEHGVRIRAVPERNASWVSWIWMLLPLVLLIGLFSRMASGQGGGPGGALAFGKAKGKIFTERDVNVTFDDVAGVDEAKQELLEVLDFLGSPDKYRALGARIPKGILLVGPPGTGKTLLARAVAGEAKVPFISISGSEFVEMFVGVGAARVRDLFEQATKAAPAIVFIDELDALGRSRSPGMMGNNEEREQTLNQLLVELDGFEPLGEGRGAVVILAATNRPEVLDPALLRAGRFDRQVVVDRPDRAGRKKILEVHARKVPLEGVDLDAIAARTPGFAGADLANLVNEAALRAAREGREVVTMADFSSAQDRVLAGLEQRSRLVDPEERRRVAFHECGHAIAARLGGSDAKVHKVSIVPRSIGALGFTMQMPERERRLFTATQLRAQLVGLVGGRAAEEIVFGEPSTGAADDLRKATDLARAMVLEHGLSEAIGPVSIERRNTYLGGVANELDVGQTTANAADAEVRRLVEQALTDAKTLLTKERARLDAMAEALLDAEVLEGDALDLHLLA